MRGVAVVSVAGVGLVVIRSIIVGHSSFLFLCWNLLLALLPLLFAHAAARSVASGKGIWWAMLWSLLWLLFFPNAPYIITDFVHLGSRDAIPLWFDAVMIGSFAWAGLMLGFQSLWLMQGLITKKYGGRIGWSFVGVVMVVSSYGIYLGRFQRWNSWDIVTQPVALVADMFSSITHPATTPQGLVLTVGMAVFLLLAYCWIAIARNGGGAERRPTEKS